MAEARPELLEYYAELFEPLGAVDARRMFGGWQLLLDGRGFAFVIHDVLYFRTDPALRDALVARGARPFAYKRKDGREIVTKLTGAPDADADDPDALRAWAVRALAVE
ncbi:MAG: TfoX/Sxy family protein [Amaricoccus sp.]|uniref:TfoX/Sxy family protein n=1 Tax=Amaricoccus sp. TaxID=1872485 RepID=UPI0039E503A3